MGGPEVVLGSVEADDLGAQVGQHHRGERPGADAADLDDPDPREGAGTARRIGPRIGRRVHGTDRTVAHSR